MFKKIAFAVPLAVLALSSSMAFAATEARHSISLKATVNSDDFYAVPVDFDLVNKDQDMSYNPGIDAMKTVDGHFDVLHTAGKVNARLEGVPKLIAGSKTIDLKVELNGKTLNSRKLSEILIPIHATAHLSKSVQSPAANLMQANTPVLSCWSLSLLSKQDFRH